MMMTIRPYLKEHRISHYCQQLTLNSVKDYNSEEDQISEKTTVPKSLFGELSPLRRSLPELPKKRRTLLTNSAQEVRSSSFLNQKVRSI